MADTPVCEKCGDEIFGGASIWCCRFATQCPMWPQSDGTPEGDGAELLMAKLWMGNALDQIGLQIDERKRLERELAERPSLAAMIEIVKGQAFIRPKNVQQEDYNRGVESAAKILEDMLPLPTPPQQRGNSE